MSAVWAACRKGGASPAAIRGNLLRLVESQERAATTALVDDLAEQELLERMLERTKPPLRPGTAHLHYLLATPFRYPPLAHGSRFGRRLEPSLLYGSLDRATLLAEAAYYRFVFWHAMAAPPPGALVTQHTLFGARYRTRAGLRLQRPPCDEHHEALAHPARYAATQDLGAALRDAGIEAIEYRSARAPQPGINVALFTPAALAGDAPTFQESWLCHTSGDRVDFSGRVEDGVMAFPLRTFEVDGRLPAPAT